MINVILERTAFSIEHEYLYLTHTVLSTIADKNSVRFKRDITYLFLKNICFKISEHFCIEML